MPQLRHILSALAVLPEDLAAALQRSLSLERAIETGTHVGGGAEKLAAIFPSVISIELLEDLHAEARRRLGQREDVELLLGDSVAVLPDIVDPAVPTFYWLDGHWTPTDGRPSTEGGGTGVGAAECPVVDEVNVLSEGHRDDCIVVDDARIFGLAPPPPFDPSQWPSALEVLDALRSARPDHHVTIAGDFFIAVPTRARATLDEVARGWMTHQGWRTTDVPMELTADGWVVDRAYQARLEELVNERLAEELQRRTLKGRIGRWFRRRHG